MTITTMHDDNNNDDDDDDHDEDVTAWLHKLSWPPGQISQKA